MTAIERVLILRGADLLAEVGPRRLLQLAEVAREVELTRGDTIYREEDAADALYMMVAGRVRLSTGENVLSEVGPGESFGTWALVDDSARGQHAECIEDGLALAVHRDAFYDVAAGDIRLLQEVVRVLARRLRALVSNRPEEARVEGEGMEKPEAQTEADASEPLRAATDAATASEGTKLAAAVLGKTPHIGDTPAAPDAPVPALFPPAETAPPAGAASPAGGVVEPGEEPSTPTT